MNDASSGVRLYKSCKLPRIDFGGITIVLLEELMSGILSLQEVPFGRDRIDSKISKPSGKDNEGLGSKKTGLCWSKFPVGI